MASPVVAVVVGAGLGLRYGGKTPKPALKVTGRTLMVMSIEAMASGGCTDAVVVINGKISHLFRAALIGSPIPVITTPGANISRGSWRVAQRTIAAGLQKQTGHAATSPVPHFAADSALMA